MSNLHFIRAPCHQSSRCQGFELAPNEIKEKYDFEMDIESFNGSVIDLTTNEIKLCGGYQILYNHINDYVSENPNKKIITIGGDNSISSGTIPAINNKCINSQEYNAKSNLIVLWIDAFSDLHTFNTSDTKNLNEMPVASLLGSCDDHFIKNKNVISPEQIIYYGLVDKDDNIDMVREYSMKFFTVKKINSIGHKNCIDYIKYLVGNNPVHINLDMKVFNSSLIKSVVPVNDVGLNIEQVEKLLVELKNNIVSMDIVEFNPNVGTKEDVKITKEVIKNLLMKTFDIKEKRLNIFTEDSQFLIYRPVYQEDVETDIGWYILRGIDIEEREQYLSQIENDDILTIEIDGEDYFITKTTMNEQYEVSYYTAITVNDVALFPEEKSLMMFELLSS